MLQSKLLEILNYRNMTIQHLADASNLSVETIKNLIYGRVSDPKLSTLLPICKSLNCSLDYLTGTGRVHWQKAQDFSSHSIQFVEKIIDLEYLLSFKNHGTEFSYRSVIIPNRFVTDGMVYDSSNIGYIDVSGHKSRYPHEIISCGVLIEGDTLEPVYFDHDVILVNCDRYPNSTEIGIFFSGDKIYIRRYIYKEHGNSVISAIHGRGSDIVIRTGNIVCFGTVIGVYRGKIEYPDQQQKAPFL